MECATATYARLLNNKTTTWKSHQNIFLCGSAAGADSREKDINARVVKKITMNLPLRRFLLEYYLEL